MIIINTFPLYSCFLKKTLSIPLGAHLQMYFMNHVFNSRKVQSKRTTYFLHLFLHVLKTCLQGVLKIITHVLLQISDSLNVLPEPAVNDIPGFSSLFFKTCSRFCLIFQRIILRNRGFVCSLSDNLIVLVSRYAALFFLPAVYSVFLDYFSS